MCGVTGIILKNEQNIAQHIYTVLYNLQHRGQESAGICVSNNQRFFCYKDAGTLDKVFGQVDLSDSYWQGQIGLGHVRYGTSGAVGAKVEAAQPMIGTFRGKPFFLVFNGNITPGGINFLSRKLKIGTYSNLSKRPAYLDTQLIVRAIELSRKKNFRNALVEVCQNLIGAFSMVAMYEDSLLAVRDKCGFRPLEFGRINRGGFVISSEDCIFNGMIGGFEKIRSIKPGEILVIKRCPKFGRLRAVSKIWTQPRPKFCLFEAVYFSRFDSHFDGKSIADFRYRLGWSTAQECPPPKNADFVLGVPDSGSDAAFGYAEGSGLRYEWRAVRRLHTAQRTFIEPVNDLRKKGTEMKFTVEKELVDGKVVVVVDDSLVRGNVAARLVYLLKKAGAKEVHFRIASPPIRYGCIYGIDTWRIESELVAGFRHHGPLSEYDIKKRIEKIILNRYRQKVTLDSIKYLSLEGMLNGYKSENLCTACWTGDYPV